MQPNLQQGMQADSMKKGMLKPTTMDMDPTTLKQLMTGQGMAKSTTLGTQPTTLATLLANMSSDVSASMCIDASESFCSMAQMACSNPKMASMPLCSKIAPMCAAGGQLQGWDLSAAVCLERSMPLCDGIMKVCSDSSSACPPELLQMCSQKKSM